METAPLSGLLQQASGSLQSQPLVDTHHLQAELTLLRTQLQQAQAGGVHWRSAAELEQKTVLDLRQQLENAEKQWRGNILRKDFEILICRDPRKNPLDLFWKELSMRSLTAWCKFGTTYFRLLESWILLAQQRASRPHYYRRCLQIHLPRDSILALGISTSAS